jgi:hypothetical protein
MAPADHLCHFCQCNPGFVGGKFEIENKKIVNHQSPLMD